VKGTREKNSDDTPQKDQFLNPTQTELHWRGMYVEEEPRESILYIYMMDDDNRGRKRNQKRRET